MLVAIPFIPHPLPPHLLTHRNVGIDNTKDTSKLIVPQLYRLGMRMARLYSIDLSKPRVWRCRTMCAFCCSHRDAPKPDAHEVYQDCEATTVLQICGGLLTTPPATPLFLPHPSPTLPHPTPPLSPTTPFLPSSPLPTSIITPFILYLVRMLSLMITLKSWWRYGIWTCDSHVTST